ncbi:hypothetical protein P4O66_012040 [Electrophorus voltai]|uniref:Uncharacterized protein n=1 Tax=Electrophorus voltai TaxID=2609070 RepID=A0AAD8Z6W7_9TELE|nr:hypothetical protein P4O66_012040 [Electrophorus voltai]
MSMWDQGGYGVTVSLVQSKSIFVIQTGTKAPQRSPAPTSVTAQVQVVGGYSWSVRGLTQSSMSPSEDSLRGRSTGSLHRGLLTSALSSQLI